MTVEQAAASFDGELSDLNLLIAQMGGLAEVQLRRAIQCLVNRDGELADLVRASDKEIDKIEGQVHLQAVQLLGLRQPLADDLRRVIAAFQTASALERIGDYARNIAKRSTVLNQMPAMIGPVGAIDRMNNLVQSMISDVLNAYQTLDTKMAEDVRARDIEVDQLHTSLFRELLTYMMEDPHNITACTHLLFIAKNVERIGDHTTNIAEYIHMVVYGKEHEEDRIKQDRSSLTSISANDVLSIEGARKS
jgi:phosphate transport system protein